MARQYLKKGSNVFVQGELVYKKWKDKQDVEHTTAEIQAHLLQMLGSNTGNNSAPQSQPQQNPAPQNNAQQTQNVENFDDMPF